MRGDFLVAAFSLLLLLCVCAQQEEEEGVFKGFIGQAFLQGIRDSAPLAAAPASPQLQREADINLAAPTLRSRDPMTFARTMAALSSTPRPPLFVPAGRRQLGRDYSQFHRPPSFLQVSGRGDGEEETVGREGFDIEDCTACRMVWEQVRMDVGHARFQEDPRKSFIQNCIAAQESLIFYASCEDMFADRYKMVDDYMSGKYSTLDICQRAKMCPAPPTHTTCLHYWQAHGSTCPVLWDKQHQAATKACASPATTACQQTCCRRAQKTPAQGTCTVKGDPMQYTTFDGRKFSYHVPGVYTIYKSRAEDEEIQTELQNHVSSSPIAFSVGVALGAGNDRIAVQLRAAPTTFAPVLLINGHVVDFQRAATLSAGSLSIRMLWQKGEPWFSLGTAAVLRNARTGTQVEVSFTQSPATKMHFMSLAIKRRGFYRNMKTDGGLCGTFDQNPANDWTTRRGQLAPSAQAMAASWRIHSERSSLFQ